MPALRNKNARPEPESASVACDVPNQRSRKRHTTAGIRPQRVANIVASKLRTQILRGELVAGDRLPTEEALLSQFPVAKASLREAMRILETEGLVSVQRGSKGGVEVHTPSAADAAYTLGLVMTVQRVPLDDLALAIRQLEPICAILCAERADRNRRLVPRLRSLQAQAKEKLDHQLAFTDLTRRFHEEIVAACQNRTLALLVGTLEALWSSHVKAQAHIDHAKGQPQSLSNRRSALDEHQRILDAIAAGDPGQIRRSLAEHLQRVQRKRMPAGNQMIDVGTLRS